MKIRNIFAFLFIFVLVMCNNVFAVKNNDIVLELKINNNSNQNIVDRFKFEMIPLDKNNPMPEGSVDNKYSLSVDNAGKILIPGIEFNTPGDYEYEIYQVKGDNTQFEYDESIYKVIITVVNSEDLSELETLITITKNGTDEKYSELLFENTYNLPQTETPDTSDINILLYSSIFLIGISYIIFNVRNLLQKRS